MSIGAVSSFSSAGQLAQIGSVSPGSSSPPGAAGVDSDHDGDGARVSGFGQFMQKVKGLLQSDPAQAKQVLGDIASKLRDQAKSASGPQADRLNKLADRFDQAAKSGDLSALQPGHHAGGHHHGGGHHAKAQQAYGQNSGSDASSLLQMMNATLAADTASAPAPAAG